MNHPYTSQYMHLLDHFTYEVTRLFSSFVVSHIVKTVFLLLFFFCNILRKKSYFSQYKIFVSYMTHIKKEEIENKINKK